MVTYGSLVWYYKMICLSVCHHWWIYSSWGRWYRAAGKWNHFGQTNTEWVYLDVTLPLLMSSCQDGGAENQSRQQNNAVNWVRLSAKTIGDCRHIAALTVHYSLPSQMGILLAIWQPNFPSIQWFNCVDVAIGKWTFPLNFKTISTLERDAVRANVSMFSLRDHLNQSEELFPKASPNTALVWQIDSYDVYHSPSY
jgi:hypothetical protein